MSVDPDDRLPLPPPWLAARVGAVEGVSPLQHYAEEGRRLRAVIEDLLPPDWHWQGASVLDFGCGAGRVLRRFTDLAATTTFTGCDIDRRTIEWDQGHLSPPFTFFRNELAPPLPIEPGALDLVWALSVFTHISDLWSDWIAELHRVLRPGGLLLASFLGAPMREALLDRHLDDDEVGMAVTRRWDGPYAWVFHSDWWLREHWGRAFEVLRLEHPPSGVISHSYAVLRRREIGVTPAILREVSAADERECRALATDLDLALADIRHVTAELERARASRWRSLARRAMGR